MTPKRIPKQRPAGLPGLKTIREQRQVGQADLAERMGLARQQISRWERGETSPDVWDARELAQILGVTIEDLLQAPAGA